ncbi:MAG TPA: hypothetical protein VIG99_14895 [Myxococcaceae bacterium]|jgi:hypothetical protein
MNAATRRWSFPAIAAVAALVPSIAWPCAFVGPPRMLVPGDGAADVTWQQPVLLIASPLAAGMPVLSEVLADGGLQAIPSTHSRVPYPNNPYEDRMTVVPSSPLTPDASYALSWEDQNGPNVLGRFSTGPATTVPGLLLFSAVRGPYRTQGDSGACPNDCPAFGWGRIFLLWSRDSGDTFLWITDAATGKTLAYGVTPGEYLFFPCHPDALPGSVFNGFSLAGDAGLDADGGLSIDGGTLDVVLTFLNPSGPVMVDRATLDLTCEESPPIPGCNPGPPDGDSGGEEPDAGVISPPPQGCVCPSFSQSGVIILALAMIAMRRPRKPSTSPQGPHTLR